MAQSDRAIDLLTKPKPKLSKAQEIAVKKIARDLLAKLQEYLGVEDWRAKQQTRAAVQSTTAAAMEREGGRGMGLHLRATISLPDSRSPM